MKEQKKTNSRQQRRFLQRSFKPLTNSQWEIIKNLLDKKRKRKHSLRNVFDGILKITRTGFKKINGRKRRIAVDSLGLPLAIHVSAANTYDGNEGIELFSQLEEVASELEIIFANSAYKGYFKEYAAWYKWKVEIAQRPPNEKGFVPQKSRWQVVGFSYKNY
jgi:transposase